ncbi:hypothetical protein C2845_PM16G17030 [Panicum miliaceum]|uniref:Uncharacterized protein n=1 Tax=Panicum miliaceum TaxID=4540 RepID=A0A3L6Q0M8_PANMI|nr:hypothetical protein C2845_PM16G17030 [Panicum miliaceum]
MDYMISTRNITVDENTANVDLLPKLQDNGGTPKPSLGKQHFVHHTLSLSDSHVIFLMGKVGMWEKKALLFQCQLFYTDTAAVLLGAGAKRNLKRPGKFQMLYPRKLQNGVAVMDVDAMVYELMRLYGGAQEQQDAGAEAGDNDMALG